MKKLGLLMLLGIFLAGCGTAAKESEFWEHDTMYKNWSHLAYSWYGYKEPTLKTGEESRNERWWGIGQKVDVDKLKKEFNPMKNREE